MRQDDRQKHRHHHHCRFPRELHYYYYYYSCWCCCWWRTRVCAWCAYYLFPRGKKERRVNKHSKRQTSLHSLVVVVVVVTASSEWVGVGKEKRKARRGPAMNGRMRWAPGHTYMDYNNNNVVGWWGWMDVKRRVRTAIISLVIVIVVGIIDKISSWKFPIGSPWKETKMHYLSTKYEALQINTILLLLAAACCPSRSLHYYWQVKNDERARIHTYIRVCLRIGIDR